MLNASQEFEKGRPKNFLPDEKIKKVAKAYHDFKTIDRFTKVISIEEAVKNDYNLSPSRYVETSAAEEYNDIPTLLTEIEGLEKKSKKIDVELGEVFKTLGLKSK
jgi:type I restriction enzyme M protein